MRPDDVSLRLDGKVSIITGGGSGIGAATAQLFARHGARVIVADRHATNAAAVARMIEQQGGQASSVTTDVSISADVQAMVGHTLERYGQVDILLNNAGYGVAVPFWEMLDEDWAALIGVNLTGQFLCAKYVVPHMIAQGSGVIINISSVLGYATNPGQTAYTTSKTAIIGMTKAMALDLATKNVRVNCIAPGSVDTPMMWQHYPPEDLPRIAQEAAQAVPVGRIAPPAEIASVALFLAGPAASLITGATVIADGGLLAKIATAY